MQKVLLGAVLLTACSSTPANLDLRGARIRLSWMRSFHPPIELEVTPSANGPVLQVVAPDGFDQFTTVLSTGQWGTLEQLLRDADFWSMPSAEPEKKTRTGEVQTGLDCSTLRLEVVHGSQVHWAKRWWHGDNPEFTTACVCLLRWSGLAVAETIHSYGLDHRLSRLCS